MFAGISIVLSFHDEDDMHSYDVKGDPINVESRIHYLGAECRDISLFVQVTIVLLVFSPISCFVVFPLHWLDLAIWKIFIFLQSFFMTKYANFVKAQCLQKVHMSLIHIHVTTAFPLKEELLFTFASEILNLQLLFLWDIIILLFSCPLLCALYVWLTDYCSP